MCHVSFFIGFHEVNYTNLVVCGPNPNAGPFEICLYEDLDMFAENLKETNLSTLIYIVHINRYNRF